jgi:hypothetical protein
VSESAPPPANPYASSPNAYGAPAAGQKWNVLAIIGFVSAFLLPIVPIVLGFIARGQIKRTGEKGNGLALAAIIIGFISVVLSIISIIFLVTVYAGLANGTIPTS